MKTKKPGSQQKTKLHQRSKHRERYDFKQLTTKYPEISAYVKVNDYGDETIDFFDPKAVSALNTALLKNFYDIDFWEIPKAYLCPPIPGRADYIHYIADVLAESHEGEIPLGSEIHCLDIGVGANCIYPIIGHQEYAWSFVGSDIDKIAVDSAKKIIAANQPLKDKIEIRWQRNPRNIFKDIIKDGEHFDITICNPPFHSSAEEARAAGLRKLSNLKQKKVKHARLNFGGQAHELWCEGGEEQFLKDMIAQSKDYAASCSWFSSLVSKEKTLKSVYRQLKKYQAKEIKTIAMGQGNKISRIVVWRF